MLGIVNRIAEAVGREPLAQITEISGQVKITAGIELAGGRCPQKATPEVLSVFEREILQRLSTARGGVKVDIDRALEAHRIFEESFIGGLNEGVPVLDLFKRATAPVRTPEGLSPLAILSALIAASRAEIAKISKSAGNGDNAHHQAVADNLLRLGKLIQPVQYDRIHREKPYLFMNNLDPNSFAVEVGTYKNGPDQKEPIIENKTVLVLGSGNGRDDLYFLSRGAKKVIAVDNSPTALHRIRENLESSKIGRQRKRNLIVPESPRSMMDVLEEMEAAAQKVDTIYSCSTLHYDDAERFKKMMRLIRCCLTDGGHLVFTIKLPEAEFDRDGQGIKLVEKLDTPSDIDEMGMSSNTIERARLNDDGYIRFFRQERLLLNLIQESNLTGEPNTTKLHLVKKSTVEVEKYDVEGAKPQKFGQYFLKKVPR